MEWERRFCANRSCMVGSWMVLRSRTNDTLWWVTQHHNAGFYTVAGVVPACFYCGEDLLTIVELEGGIGSTVAHEDGLVFDFLRQL